MSKWPGVLIAALAIGVIVGVVFLNAFPSVRMSPQLALLFALVGLVFASMIRIGWLFLLRKRQ